MSILKLQLEYSGHHGLQFSAFIVNDCLIAYDEGLTRNGAEGINSLAYLCVCQAEHQAMSLTGQRQLGPADSPCRKLARAALNHPNWLLQLESRFPSGLLVNHGTARQPRMAFAAQVAVEVEVITPSGERKAALTDLQGFKRGFSEEAPLVCSLRVEVSPVRGGTNYVLQDHKVRGGVCQDDRLLIHATADREVFFLLMWVNGNGLAELLFPNSLSDASGSLERGKQHSGLCFPAEGKLTVSSESGYEIGVLFVMEEEPAAAVIEKAVAEVEIASNELLDYTPFHKEWIYASVRNLELNGNPAAQAHELHLNYERLPENPAEEFLKRIGIAALAVRAVIIPNLTPQRE